MHDPTVNQGGCWSSDCARVLLCALVAAHVLQHLAELTSTVTRELAIGNKLEG